jgi:hypothetical protein
MNRSILIVICDFLLVSLLVFSSPDVNRVTSEGADRTPRVEAATNRADGNRDLAAVMQLALTEEKKSHDQLVTELTRTRGALTEREQQAQNLRQELQSRQQQQAQLSEQFALAQTNLETLNRRLQSSSVEAVMSKEQLAALEADARKRVEQSKVLQQQLNDLARSNEVVLAEKQQLALRLQVAQVEQRNALEQAARMSEEVNVERQEKAKLVEGVKVLATRSGDLAQEIRDNRPLAANTIFNDFLTNRIQASISASRSGVFGNESTRREQTPMILVSDGSNIVAFCHVQDTPLTIANPATDWEGLSGTLTRDSVFVSIKSLSFSWPDPRAIWIPLTSAEARQLGGKVYRTSADPFKFQDAVLVGARDGYYGECRFQIDPSTPDYVQLDRSFLKGLFGKFNPSRGDLVFSKTGELLGVMVNGTYCLVVRKFDPMATFQFASNMHAQRVGEVLSQLSTQVTRMPLKLQ